MRFSEYLIEATFDPYQQFSQEYQNVLGKEPPSKQKLLGLMNRRTYSPGSDEEMDFITDWFIRRGYLTQKGKMVVPTAKGSQLRQTLSTKTHTIPSVMQADNYKRLRKYFMDITNEITKEWLMTLDDKTLEMIAKGRELEQEDIAILNGIRERAEKHRERQSYIFSMMEKSPDRLNRLIELGFITSKTYNFNKGAWDDFVNTISSLDPARVRTVIPNFFQWATHASGNVAKNVNRILFAIHPDSRNRTETGRLVWDMIKNLPDDIVASIQAGKKPRQGKLSDKSYNLLTSIVASVIRTFPNAKNSDDLIKLLNDAFESRVDFKSLDRSSEKVTGRRDAFKRVLQ